MDSGTQGFNFPPKKKSADLMSHDPPQRKKGPQSLQGLFLRPEASMQSTGP